MLAAGAVAAGEMPATVKTGDSSLGSVLTDTKGMTLYYFDQDVAGKSNCNGKCATAWPPLMVGP
jgi:predicted lipoprotein with Yx(FWY)xxD motif